MLKDAFIIVMLIMLGIVFVSVLCAPNTHPTNIEIKSENQIKNISKELESQTLEISTKIENIPQVIVNEEYLNSMKLHEEIYINNKSGNILIIKVPNGWIYNSDQTPVFVPERK